MTLVYLSSILLILYCLLILYYRSGWKELKIFDPGTGGPSTKISVIIPARNEEDNIERLLKSIRAQSYPRELYEVIVIDDHSTDNTATIVKSFPGVRFIQLAFDNLNSYKKKAIEIGVQAATGELIVTTDADCIVPVDWLKTIASFKEKNDPVFIASPVVINPGSSFVQVFQALDFLVLQGITASSVQKNIHSMCNGANLAYEKKAFLEVNGFQDIDHIASGDDMLLMHKMVKQYPGKVQYLFSEKVIVSTLAVHSWKEFFNQRIRWASKAIHYNEIKIFSALFLVYFFNLSLLVLFFTGFWNHYLWPALGLILVIKIIVEWSFVFPVARFYKKEKLMNWFIVFQPVHVLYTIIAGWFGLVGRFEWKGRKVK